MRLPTTPVPSGGLPDLSRPSEWASQPFSDLLVGLPTPRGPPSGPPNPCRPLPAHLGGPPDNSPRAWSSWKALPEGREWLVGHPRGVGRLSGTGSRPLLDDLPTTPNRMTYQPLPTAPGPPGGVERPTGCAGIGWSGSGGLPGGLAEVEQPSRWTFRGWEALSDDRHGSERLCRRPTGVGKPSQRVGISQEALLEFLEGLGGHSKGWVRLGSPLGGLIGVGRSSRRAGRGQEALLESRQR